MEPDSPVIKEYGRAAAFLEGMNRLRQAWAGFHPAAPLNRGDIMVLGMVDELTRQGKPVTVSELARRTHQSLPGASQKASGLEQMGYLCRTADESDRRVSYLELTAEGRQMAEGALRVFLRQIEQALDILGREKTETLLALVCQLSDAMDMAGK